MGETGEFFGHERSDLALQNDELSVDPVIFTVFLRNPCLCNDSSNDLDFFDFWPEPKMSKKYVSKKIWPQARNSHDLILIFSQ